MTRVDDVMARRRAIRRTAARGRHAQERAVAMRRLTARFAEAAAALRRLGDVAREHNERLRGGS